MPHTCIDQPSIPSGSLNGQYCFVADATHDALRIDKFVADKLIHFSRSFLQNLISKGKVTINDIAIFKTSTKIRPSDKIEITIPPLPTLDIDVLKQATNGVQIIYEHEHFLIINKPAGLFFH